MVGVKTHMYKSDTTFNSDDLILISASGEPSTPSSVKTSTPETPPPLDRPRPPLLQPQPPTFPVIPSTSPTLPLPEDGGFTPNPPIPDDDIVISENTPPNSTFNPDYPLFPPFSED